MLTEITQILRKTPGLTGREIAKKIGVEKKAVNSYLAKNSTGLCQKDWKWFLEENEYVLPLTSNTWVTAKSFEADLKLAGCCFQSDASRFIIRFPAGCRILLIAGARIMAIANQLAAIKKYVCLDFEACPPTKHYLNRLGFFDHLDSKVDVLPGRPAHSKAKQYKGNSNNLVEVATIDLQHFDESLPEKLTSAFTHHANATYHMAAYTVFSELIGNIQEHSDTPIPGFAALQLYKGARPHIQTVVSDSGLGISKTLKTKLKEHYPEICEKLDLNSVNSDIFLVKKALVEGGLSQFGSDPNLGRGCGLNRSQNYAVKYNADITVRQDSFEVYLQYKEGHLNNDSAKQNLPIIHGTQVCFDFFID